MKIAMFSDTHTKHLDWYGSLNTTDKHEFDTADVLIHTGDFTNVGSLIDVHSFFKWYASLPNPNKIVIAGNHDFFFDTATPSKRGINYTQEDIDDVLVQYPTVTYLHNTHTIIDGYKVWGSPINKWFYDWAFNKHEGVDINKYWDAIPNDTDILLTHGPMYNVLDTISNIYTDGVEHVGDSDLLKAVARVKPKLFVCGHIHEGHGKYIYNDTLCVNASVLDDGYSITYPPVFTTLP